jgi:hypothetical protein
MAVIVLHELYWDGTKWTYDNIRKLELEAQSVKKDVQALWRFYRRKFYKPSWRNKWAYTWTVSGEITSAMRDKLEWFASRKAKYVFEYLRMKTPNATETAWETDAAGNYTGNVTYVYDEEKAAVNTASDDAVIVVIEGVSFQDVRPGGEYYKYEMKLRRILGNIEL